MTIQGAQERISAALLAWDGVSGHPHRFGGTEYRLDKRELGHIHADQLVDIPFPTLVRDENVSAGKAQAHHILPDSGWVSLYLRREEDVGAAIELFARSYEIARTQRSKRAPIGEVGKANG